LETNKLKRKTQLISIPYAGGSRYSFNDFHSALAKKNIEASTIELPGRGKRVFEALLFDINQMVDDLYQQIQPFLNQDYILYGHSMGGTLGNLLICKIQEAKKRLPLHFLVTGCAAPAYKDKEIILHELEEKRFREELKKLGGLPDEILENKELMDYFSPIIRADITALENLDYQPVNKYKVPVTAIAGTEEKLTEEQLQGWGEETTERFEYLYYEGNHFFILNAFERLASLIKDKVAYSRTSSKIIT